MNNYLSNKFGILAVFIVLFLLLLELVGPHIHPLPLFSKTNINTIGPIPVTNRPLVYRLKLPKSNVGGFWVHIEKASENDPIYVSAADVTRDKSYHSKITAHGWQEVRISEPSLKATTFELTFHAESTGGEFPALSRNGASRSAPHLISIQPEEPSEWPLLVIRYQPWFHWLIGAWPLAILFLFLARSSLHLSIVAIVLSILTAFSSIAMWEQTFTLHSGHYDPDRYGRYAEQLFRFLSDPNYRTTARTWVTRYPHAPHGLISWMIVPLLYLSNNTSLVYVALSATISFIGVIFLIKIAEALKFQRWITSIMILYYCSHVQIIRMFAKAQTDSLGVTFTIIMLYLLIQLNGRQRPVKTVLLYLSLTALGLALSRPQGLGIWPFLALSVLGIEARWAGGPKNRQVFLAPLYIFTPALATLTALYYHFGWVQNLEMSFEKAKAFRSASTPQFFLYSCVAIFQITPLLLIFNRNNLRKNPIALLCVSWIIFYLVLLGTVQAPFWPRHFTGLIPALSILLGMVSQRLKQHRVLISVAIFCIACINVYAIFLQLDRPTYPAKPWRWIITSS